MSSVRQLDKSRYHSDFSSIPKWLPGRLESDDFFFFKYPRNLDISRYTVVIEGLDMSDNNPYRSVGPLDKAVEIPAVKLGWHPRIGVVPDTDALPSFEAELIRGSTYIIPDVSRSNGVFQMERHGIHRPN